MTAHDCDTDIGGLIDGTLPRERTAEVEAHLAACGRCRALAADFRALRAAAASLERRNPPPQVWTRLAVAVAAPPAGRMPFWRAWTAPGAFRSAFAAAVLLALLTAGTWMAWRDVSQSRPPAPAQLAPGATAGADQDLGNAETTLRTEISHLEGLVDPALLPQETKAAYEESGAVIDSAINAADTVRQNEPSNELAQQSLFEALRSKLTLLQEMLSLVNEMRKGNQEEAARIVSEMEP